VIEKASILQVAALLTVAFRAAIRLNLRFPHRRVLTDLLQHGRSNIPRGCAYFFEPNALVRRQDCRRRL